jgi:hypothetical protein
MTTVDVNAGGTLTGTTITATTGFVGNGSGLTNLPPASINLGVNNVPVITNGSGSLTTETFLSAVRGGTGVTSAAATGIPHVTAGSWTFSGIASADLAPGFAVTNAQTTATSSNVINTIVSRDGSGGFGAGTIFSAALAQTATVTTAGTSIIRSANVQSVNNAPTAIFSITAANNTVFAAEVSLACFDTTDATNNTGFINYYVKASSGAAGAIVISTLANVIKIADSNILAIDSTVTSTGANNVTINVIGVIAKTINWLGTIKTLSQG